MSENDTLARIHDLADKLQERLNEAEDIRARLTDARRTANSWPDLHRRHGRSVTCPAYPISVDRTARGRSH